MLRSLIDEVEEELALREKDESISHTISIATGYSAAPVLRQLADRVQEKYPNVYTEVYPIVNHFFGERITVAGLLTFQDLKEQLLEKNLGERLLLPSTIVKSDEDLFLDDYRVGRSGNCFTNAGEYCKIKRVGFCGSPFNGRRRGPFIPRIGEVNKYE